MKIKVGSLLRKLTATTRRKVIVGGVVAALGAAGVGNAEKLEPIADAVVVLATLL